MNELATTETFVSPYKLALLSDKILEMKKGDAMSGITDIISKCYHDLGQVVPGYDTKVQAQHLKILTNDLFEEVKMCFRFLRMEELRLALRNGSRKQYGDFFGINVATFHGWIKGYLAEEKRREALNQIKSENERPPKPLMSESEAEYEFKQAIKKHFEIFKENGTLNIYSPSYTYEWFERNGLIKLSEDEKKVIYEQAKINCLKHKGQLRVNPKNRIELISASNFINRANNGLLTKEDKAEIKSEARSIALKQYFESIDKLPF